RRFTASLLTAGSPERRLVAPPHGWTFRSVRSPQWLHQRCSCTRAPSKLSVTEPTMPAAAQDRAVAIRHPMVLGATAAIGTDAARDAARPAGVMAPDSPGAAFRPVVRLRGSPPQRVPTSVAQVSAAAAATLP